MKKLVCVAIFAVLLAPSFAIMSATTKEEITKKEGEIKKLEQKLAKEKWILSLANKVLSIFHKNKDIRKEYKKNAEKYGLKKSLLLTSPMYSMIFDSDWTKRRRVAIKTKSDQEYALIYLEQDLKKRKEELKKLKAK